MEGIRGQSRAAVPSHLGWSIFTTLCCCLPLGIAAIVCSCRVGNHFQASTTADASRTAKILNVVGLVCGIIFMIIFIALKGLVLAKSQVYEHIV
uniref:Uncharacterized protein n=1 Tax=Salarias fasciatus TaxID=181472 RepID=A0A672HDW3_SALFA